jgi:hypothetical protein
MLEKSCEDDLHNKILKKSMDIPALQMGGPNASFVETFEYLHEVFFQTVVIFFCAIGFVPVRALSTLDQFTTLTQLTIQNVSSENGNKIILAYSLFAISHIVQLAFAPTTFTNYCLSGRVKAIINSDEVACSIIDDMAVDQEGQKKNLCLKEETNPF